MFGKFFDKPKLEIEKHIVGNTVMYFKNGKLHNDGDCAAIVSFDGIHKWYKNGLLHRDNGPAIICPDGSEHWFKNDLLHRDGDLPAESTWVGNKWCKNGLFHRDGDKPAIVTYLGIQKWYNNGLLHRELDKPAVIWPDCTNRSPEWWYNGVRYYPYRPNIDWRREGF